MTVTINEPNPDNKMGIQHYSNSKLVKAQVNKEDKAVIEPQALSVEDEWDDMYFDFTKNANGEIIRPPFEPKRLAKLVVQNNALDQCVSAMEVNIDGTGFKVTNDDIEEETEDKNIADGIEDFFNEIFPNMSFITARRKLRRDQEITGNAYLEVLRAVNGNIVFAKPIESHMIRLVKLDDPVQVATTVTRFGNDQKVFIMKRERRFAQLVGKKIIYFKEFGSSRELNRITGKWETEENPVKPEERATEIIHFYPVKDAVSPYGLPRWINQVPSVLGSRKAEELNLDFFNAGGLPPALITIQGGELTAAVRKQLDAFLSGKGKNLNRAAIVEVHSSGGDLNSSGNVRVTVERFGAERQQDSMFEKYDDKCEQRVRSSFRLPPLFVGKANDYSFATAYASYSVAEAQVFQPEREEFDEIMNNTIMKEIADGYSFKSLPLNVKDAAQQLQGIEMAGDAIDKATKIDAINEVTHLDLVMSEEDANEITDTEDENPPADAANDDVEPTQGTLSPPAQAIKVQKMDPMQMIDLASQWAAFSSGEYMPEDTESLVQAVKGLTGSQRDLFDGYVAIKLMSGFDHDPEGAVELMGAATEIMALKHDEDCGCGCQE